MTTAAPGLGVVYFIDTSVLDEVLETPGWAKNPQVLEQFKSRVAAGQRMAVPITALIESGNHIEQSSGPRRAAAERYATLIDQLLAGTTPWKLAATAWDPQLLQAMRDGAHTGRSLVDLLDSKSMGGGDAAILVEAERLLASSFGLQVGLWTLDAGLRSNWPFGNLL